MPNIKSQLGTKNVGESKREVFTVEDESGATRYPPSQAYAPIDEPMPIIREEPQRRRRTPPREYLTNDERADYSSQKRDIYQQQSKISMGSKNRIEILLGIGRLTSDVEYDGVTFTLQSLKSREMREIYDSIKERKPNDLDINYEIRVQTLARAISHIDGFPIEDFLGSRYINDKMRFIDELQERMVTFLHQKYSDMVTEGQEEFGVKNKQEAEELAEEVKKS